MALFVLFRVKINENLFIFRAFKMKSAVTLALKVKLSKKVFYPKIPQTNYLMAPFSPIGVKMNQKPYIFRPFRRKSGVTLGELPL